MAIAAKPTIAVLGGGFGGLETAFYLRKKLLDRADITIISDRDHFLFKPNTIYIPFGLNPEKLKIPLRRPTRRKAIHFIQAKVEEVDPKRRRSRRRDRRAASTTWSSPRALGCAPRRCRGWPSTPRPSGRRSTC